MTNTIDSTGDGDLSLFALRRNRHGATGAGSAVDRSTGLNFTRLPAQLRCADWISFLAAEKTKPPLPLGNGGCHEGKPDDYLLSHGQSALSSAWSRFTVLF
ncbi:hypothetical protein QZM89_28330, partial [Burkholderia gladioli]|uniref:hypothetical protein n=4 Tax=Burkholderia gladioli TaxID=28095 RepID=UPI001ABB9FB5